jgi:protein-L-isoaspartate O-methyltransferase
MVGASDRIAHAVAALALRPGMRVLEIGCGPGVAARGVAKVVGPRGSFLGLDRSATAIAQATRSSAEALGAGSVAFRITAIEGFVHAPDEAPFDLAFALRVGAPDGRHPAVGALALPRIKAALVPGGRLFVDTGDPLAELA